MSDYDLILLFNEFFNTTYARLNDFMTGLFAMLIAAYLVAPKLTRDMSALVVGLYVLFGLSTIVPALAATSRFVRTGAMLESAAAKPGSFLSEIVVSVPSGPIVMPVMGLLMLAAYFGALLFFFRARKET